MILFPAIAVDAAGAGIRNAVSDSCLHLWPILLAVVCILAPLFAIDIVLPEYYSAYQSLQDQFILAVATAICCVTWTAILAAAASYIYACYGNHLGRPPDLPKKTAA
jgi:hypothetical protein